MGSAAGRHVPRPSSHGHREPLALRTFGVCKGETLLVEYGIGPFTINLLGAPSKAASKATTSRPSRD